MTTITETTIHQPAGMTRRTIISFLAGAILAGGVAVGVNVASGDAATAPTTQTVHAAHVVGVQEPGCYVVRGAC